MVSVWSILAALLSVVTPSSWWAEGMTVPVWQWCDDQPAFERVVDRHAHSGIAAAQAEWATLVAAGRCHWIPAQLATSGLLVNRVYTVEAVISDWPVVIEIWLAGIDGVRPHGYIALYTPQFAEPEKINT